MDGKVELGRTPLRQWFAHAEQWKRPALRHCAGQWALRAESLDLRTETLGAAHVV